METKKCLQCYEILSLDNFHKDKSRRDGYREKCKNCRCKYPSGDTSKKCIACDDIFIVKNKNAKQQKYCGDVCQRVHIRYGINEYDLENLLIKSNYKCSICGCEETNIDKRTNKKYSLSIDHCHASGVVRGVLCSSCNNALGLFKDDLNILNNAIKYLTDAKKEYSTI